MLIIDFSHHAFAKIQTLLACSINQGSEAMRLILVAEVLALKTLQFATRRDDLGLCR
jgi:hypothetical protein